MSEWTANHLRPIAEVIGRVIWPANGNGITPTTAPEDAAWALVAAGFLGDDRLLVEIGELAAERDLITSERDELRTLAEQLVRERDEARAALLHLYHSVGDWLMQHIGDNKAAG